MHRSGWAKSLRGIAVTGGAVAAFTLTGVTVASASDTSARSESAWPRQEAPAQHVSTTAGGYRGTQGFNLCLLSRCSTGSGDDTRGGTGLVQGGNLCLLSFCEVRP